MAIGIKEYLKAVLLPAAMLIIIGIMSLLADSFVSTSGLMVGINTLILMADFAVVIWAGYSAVKKNGMGVKGAMVSTAAAGAIASFVVISMYVAIIKPPSVMAVLDRFPPTLDTMIGFALGIIIANGIISIIIAIPCAIIGAAGAFIAGGGKEPAPDTGECFKAALLPAAVLVGLGIIMRLALHFNPVASGVVLLTDWLFNLLEFVVFAWVGYSAVKKGMGIRGSVMVSAIAGAIVGLVNSIRNLVFAMLGIQAVIGTFTADFSSAAGIAVFGINTIVGIVFVAFLAAICGIIGAYFAGRKTEPRPVHPAATGLLSKREIGKKP